MYRVDRNDFYREEKNATVYTPESVSDFVFQILYDKIDKTGCILDPCVGRGSLLEPFRRNGYHTIGIDIEDQGYPDTIVRDFISISPGELPYPALVIANPPFNVDSKTKDVIAAKFGRRPLLPEVWLHKCVELWGQEVPLVLFAPYGLRLNQTVKSQRWKRFRARYYPPIQAIISLPKNIYQDVLFHSEILIFNVDGLQGHYFYDG